MRDEGTRSNVPSTRELIERAFARGDHDEVVRVITSRPLEAWFGLPPAELAMVLSGLPPEARQSTPVLASFSALLLGSHAPPASAVDPTPVRPGAGERSWTSAEQAMITALFYRSRGEVLRAAECSHQFDYQPHGTVLFDPGQGREIFLAVQLGLTEMQVGNYSAALSHFTSAELMPVNSELRFFVREAAVKSALIHALFGDHYTATALLKRAGHLKRTASWVEANIDATLALTKLLLKRDLTPKSPAFRQFDELSLRDLGEMWPFYVTALYRLYASVGMFDEFIARLRVLEQAYFPRVPGEGAPGSVFSLTLGMSAVYLGNYEFAKSLLGEVDSSMLEAQLLRGVIELRTGDYDAAIASQRALASETEPLRQLEISRTVTLAAALIANGDSDEGAAELRRLMRRVGSLGSHEITLALPETGELMRRYLGARSEELRPIPVASTAAQVLRAGEQCEAASAAGASLASDGVQPRISLTPREFDILRLSQEGLRRAEMADRLFVSINTIKTHQRALFKKLQVHSTRQLLEEAARLGLID